MNIVLIGYRCCGKTSTGKLIAEKLGRQFVDTDELIIEKAGFTIDEIVSIHGWQYFRDLESDVVREISSRDNLVIATGGGVIINEENVKNLKAKGFVVWLFTDPDTIRKRLREDKSSVENRPSLTGDDPSDEITKVLGQRKPLYMKASDVAIDTTELSVGEVADRIIEKIKNSGQRSEI